MSRQDISLKQVAEHWEVEVEQVECEIVPLSEEVEQQGLASLELELQENTKIRLASGSRHLVYIIVVVAIVGLAYLQSSQLAYVIALLIPALLVAREYELYAR